MLGGRHHQGGRGDPGEEDRLTRAAMEKGFIMLSRKFFSHKMWEAARTFSECEAWLDLIQSARFEATDQTECIGGREITYGRGQYPASIRFLAKRWRWSERGVRTFLAKLTKEKMIDTDNRQGMNVLTLRNYDLYNGSAATAATEVDKAMSQEISRLTSLVTRLAEELPARGRHTGDTNSNKEDNDKNFPLTETSTVVEAKTVGVTAGATVGLDLGVTAGATTGVTVGATVGVTAGASPGMAGKLAAAKAATLRRREEFYYSLVPHLERYGKEMLRAFFDYWSEMNRQETKMRFETNKTWEVAKRLATWEKKERFDGKPSRAASAAGASAPARAAGDKAASRQAVGQLARAVLEQYKSDDSG